MTDRADIFHDIAKASDAAALAHLRREFMASQISMGLLDVPQDLEAHLEKSTLGLIESRRSHVLLAKNLCGPVGYATAVVRFVPDARSRTVGLIEEVFVEPGCAIGSAVGRNLATNLIRDRFMK